MNVEPEEAREIMHGDPCVQASMILCHICACHGFPGETRCLGDRLAAHAVVAAATCTALARCAGRTDWRVRIGDPLRPTVKTLTNRLDLRLV